MTQPPLLEIAPRGVADTSREAWDRIREHVTEREWHVLRALYDFTRLERDATGGELASYMERPVTSIRPRLTGLAQRGWIQKTPARASRVPGEGRCHGYKPVLPLAAVLRAKVGVTLHPEKSVNPTIYTGQAQGEGDTVSPESKTGRTSVSQSSPTSRHRDRLRLSRHAEGVDHPSAPRPHDTT